MKQIYGDFWLDTSRVKVITTNPIINARGEAVMGRGIALQAKAHIPGIALHLAMKIRTGGNHVHYLCTYENVRYVSFPVKEHWKRQAKLDLIKQSCHEIVALADDKWWRYITLPRPGCGNGGLDWKDVEPVLTSILDDRFYVIDRKR